LSDEYLPLAGAAVAGFSASHHAEVMYWRYSIGIVSVLAAPVLAVLTYALLQRNVFLYSMVPIPIYFVVPALMSFAVSILCHFSRGTAILHLVASLGAALIVGYVILIHLLAQAG